MTELLYGMHEIIHPRLQPFLCRYACHCSWNLATAPTHAVEPYVHETFKVVCMYNSTATRTEERT